MGKLDLLDGETKPSKLAEKTKGKTVGLLDLLTLIWILKEPEYCGKIWPEVHLFFRISGKSTRARWLQCTLQLFFEATEATEASTAQAFTSFTHCT